jgi:hypothetical protein
MLTAFDPRLLNLTSSDARRFSLTTSFESTSSDVAFTVTNVYALSDHDLTQDFVEMISLSAVVSGAWLIFGDFNLIRVPAEKNNSNFNRALADAFNAMIHAMALFELPLLDRLYTWTNGQECPVLARLDRAFFNHEWNSSFPMSSLTSLPRPTSDHVPIVVTASTKIPCNPCFRFENAWLLDASFLPSTLPHWNRDVPARNAAVVLVTKVKRFHFAAKVWKKSHRFIPTHNNNCRFVIDLFDFFEEYRPLDTAERTLRQTAQDALALSVKQKAAFWKQRGQSKKEMRTLSSSTREPLIGCGRTPSACSLSMGWTSSTMTAKPRRYMRSTSSCWVDLSLRARVSTSPLSTPAPSGRTGRRSLLLSIARRLKPLSGAWIGLVPLVRTDLDPVSSEQLGNMLHLISTCFLQTSMLALLTWAASTERMSRCSLKARVCLPRPRSGQYLYRTAL